MEIYRRKLSFKALKMIKNGGERKRVRTAQVEKKEMKFFDF